MLGTGLTRATKYVLLLLYAIIFSEFRRDYIEIRSVGFYRNCRMFLKKFVAGLDLLLDQ